ncbi:unnamed protein product [Ectocarpus fasciculatus]
MGNKHAKSRSGKSKVVADNQRPQQPHQVQQPQPLHGQDKGQAKPSTLQETPHKELQGDAGSFPTSIAGEVDGCPTTTEAARNPCDGQRIPNTQLNPPPAVPDEAARQPPTMRTPTTARKSENSSKAPPPVNELPTETEVPMAMGVRSIDRQPTTRVAGGDAIDSTSPSTHQPLQPRQQQQQQHQQHQQHNEPQQATPEPNAAEGDGSSNDGGPPGAAFAATATDGYVSFSESEESESLSMPAFTTLPEQQRSSRSSASHEHGNRGDAADGQAERQSSGQQANALSIREGGSSSADDKWDFGEDSEDEPEAGGKEVAAGDGRDKGRHNGRNEHHERQQDHHHHPSAIPVSPVNGVNGGRNDSNAGEKQQVQVVVDRLGRRQNAPGRELSSSSSEDEFDGWGDDDDNNEDDDDDEEEEGEDDTDEDDDGNVYDWTVMDTGDGSLDGEAEGMDDPRKPSDGSVGEGNQPGASVAKPRAEANPLASKLGLGASVPRVAMPPAMARAAAHMLQQQGSGRGQGPGRGRGRPPHRGRGYKAVAPGRGGRPRYSPLMQASHHRYLCTVTNNHARSGPPAPNGGRVGPGAGSTPAGTRSPDIGAVAPPGAGAVVTTQAAATTTTTAASSSPMIPRGVRRDMPGGGAGGGRGRGGDCARSSSGVAGGERGDYPTSAAAAGYSGVRPVTAAAAAAASASASAATTSEGTIAKTAGGSARPASGSPGASATGANRSARSGAASRSGEMAASAQATAVAGAGAAASTALPKEKEVVKDTANITRKKAQLPQQEQLEHPTPVGGSWLKNRYIVNNYILLEPLGTGSYAEVRLAKEKTSNTLYAVKIMNKDFLKKRQVGKEETFMDSIKREIAIMKKVHHPNVLRLYEVMDDPKVNKLYLVLEYCKKGDLMNILNGDTRTVTCDPMNDTDVWYIMRQIVQGLSFLHLQNIVHGDIKPQNLLVGSDNVAKIADFGISKFVQGSNQRLQEQAGTPTFMSPELCYGEGYSGQLADVWALGATMYMIRCGKPPFMANQVMVLYEKIQNDPLDFPPEVNMSPGLRRLLRAMMEKDPAKRIILDHVLADRWLQQGDYGPARTTTAGGVRTNVTTAPAGAGVVNSSAHGIPASSSNVGDTGGNIAGITRNSNNSSSSSSGGPVNGGGGGVGLGLRPPPSLSFLPLTEQGYRAIKVSDDEVHKSINQGITTGGNSGPGSAAGGGSTKQQRCTTAANSLTPPILEESAATPTTTSPAVAGSSGGNSPSPAISPSGGTGVGGVQHGEGGASRNSGGSSSNSNSSGRGHLSETEESWKFRSFKKKIEENASDPKFRGAAIASPAGEARPRQVPATPNGSAGRPPHPATGKPYLSSTTNTRKTATATGATPSPPSSLPPRSASAAQQQHHHPQKQQQHARGHEIAAPAAPSGDSFFDDTDEGDDDDDDDFSSEDNPDTLYDGSGSVSTASPRSATAMSPSSGSRATSSAAEAGRGEPRPSVGQHRGGRGRGRGGGVGMRGGGPMLQHQAGGRRPSEKRRSSEKFDAVMDTLAAQPPCRGGRGGGVASRCTGTGSTGSGGGDRSRTLSGSVRPLRDLSLRGVKVRSSARGGASAGAPSQVPGESSCNPWLGLVAAASQRQGKRASQEDRVVVAADLATAVAGKVDREYLYQHLGLFGVFDGHNGQMSSEALRAGLHLAVAKQPTFHQAPDKAVVQAFNCFDKDLCARQEQEGDTSGSTALVVVFDGRSRSILVANVGDSRCVASCGGGVAARLSSDHRLSRPDERARVVASGGFVTNDRINGVLAVSRSFGDVQHKEGKSPGLTATPELRSERVISSTLPSGGGVGGGGSMEFVILATDGLWDVIEDQEAVNFIRVYLSEKNGDLSGAARELTKLALDQGSVDNVSAVLVWFEENGTEGAPREQQEEQHQHQPQRQRSHHQQQQRPHQRQHSKPHEPPD